MPSQSWTWNGSIRVVLACVDSTVTLTKLIVSPTPTPVNVPKPDSSRASPTTPAVAGFVQVATVPSSAWTLGIDAHDPPAGEPPVPSFRSVTVPAKFGPDWGMRRPS